MASEQCFCSALKHAWHEQLRFRLLLPQAGVFHTCTSSPACHLQPLLCTVNELINARITPAHPKWNGV